MRNPHKQQTCQHISRKKLTSCHRHSVNHITCSRIIQVTEHCHACNQCHNKNTYHICLHADSRGHYIKHILMPICAINKFCTLKSAPHSDNGLRSPFYLPPRQNQTGSSVLPARSFSVARHHLPWTYRQWTSDAGYRQAHHRHLP